MAAAISTYQTYLMYKASGATSYAKLIDIVSFPDIGSEPDTIETTSLTDDMQTFIPGIISSDGNWTFGANYTASNYSSIKALNDGAEKDLALWFGGSGAGASATPTGSKGKFTFKGYVTPTISGGGVNEKVTMNVVVTVSGQVTWEAGT